MIDISIEIDDYLNDEDIIELVQKRQLRNRILYGCDDSADSTIDLTPRRHWEDLADDLRDAAIMGDRTHFEVLLLRMADMAGVPRHRIPGPTWHMEARA